MHLLSVDNFITTLDIYNDAAQRVRDACPLFTFRFCLFRVCALQLLTLTPYAIMRAFSLKALHVIKQQYLYDEIEAEVSCRS